MPRHRPLPKPKPMTKWEKFRIERGLPPRRKRGRMVFDPITNDWVPRWGAGSIKHIEASKDVVIEEKPGDIPIEKMDLFEQRSM